jgi:hypothetical protein
MGNTVYAPRESFLRSSVLKLVTANIKGGENERIPGFSGGESLSSGLDFFWLPDACIFRCSLGVAFGLCIGA